MLRWLKDRNLPITQNSLQQAFDDLKHQLAISPDSNAEYNGTRQSRATGRAAGRGLNP